MNPNNSDSELPGSASVRLQGLSKSFAGAIKALGATSLYLFGSSARDEAGAASDIHLFLDYDPRGRFNALDLVAAKRLLEQRLGVEVDLTTRKGVHPLIRKKIEAEATQVF